MPAVGVARVPPVLDRRPDGGHHGPGIDPGQPEGGPERVVVRLRQRNQHQEQFERSHRRYYLISVFLYY